MTSYEYLFLIPDIFKTPWCLYAHECGGEVIYIGSGAISRAFGVSHQDRTDRWRAVVGALPVRVGILSFHETRESAAEAERAALAHFKPRANINGVGTFRGRGMKRRVMCETDGRMFPSTVAAARACGVSQSAVCNVASGRQPDVRGMRFRYID